MNSDCILRQRDDMLSTVSFGSSTFFSSILLKVEKVRTTDGISTIGSPMFKSVQILNENEYTKKLEGVQKTQKFMNVDGVPAVGDISTVWGTQLIGSLLNELHDWYSPSQFATSFPTPASLVFEIFFITPTHLL